MTMTVSGPNGLRINFPDGTSADTINSVMSQAHAKMQANAPAAPAQPKTSAIGAAARGFQNESTLGFGGKVAGIDNYLRNIPGLGAAMDAVNPLGAVMHLLTGGGDEQSFNDKQAADATQHPTARLAGQAAGVVGSAALPVGDVAQGANWLAKLGRGALTGAGYGAVSGAGHADPGKRIEGAAYGGVGGAVLGVAAVPAAAVLGKFAGPVVRDFVSGARDGANRGVAALSRRVYLDPTKMATKAAAYRAAGVEPTLTDVVPPQARSVIAAAGQTAEGGHKLVDQATSRAADLPSRVADAAREKIAGGSDTAANLETNLKAARTEVGDLNYSAARDDHLPLTTDAVNLLGTDEGTNAIRAASRLVSPDERPAYMKLSQWIRTGAAKGDPPPAYTAGMAEKVRRSLNDAAGNAFSRGQSSRGAVIKSIAQGVDTHAYQFSPTLQSANTQFANMSAPINALESGSKFMGAGTKGAATPDVANELAGTQAGANPLTQSAARVAARDQVVEAAGKTPRSALGVADQLSKAPNQLERNAALLGNEAGDALANRMGIEAERVRNATRTVPGAGVPNENANAADIDAIVAHAATGGHGGMIYAMRRFLSHQGMSGANAEDLVNAAVDPARVDSAINFLSKKMGRGRATTLLGAFTRAGATLQGSIAGAAQ